MYIIAMKSGEPRRVIDLQKPNQACLKQTHQTKAPFLQYVAMTPNSMKTALDTWNGHHSVPLREEHRHLTTFLTPWGRHKHYKTPQGHIAAGHAHTRYDKTTRGFGCMERCVDDIILWEDNLEENLKTTELITKKETTTNLATNAIDATPN